MSDPIRFVHVADLHLETPFEGIAGPAPEVAEALREASFRAWDNVVDLAIAREAAFVVIAGDIYDGSERGVRAQLRFLKGLQRLSDAGVRTFIAHGNHDPLDGWSAIREFPAGAHAFGHDAPETVEVEVDGQSVFVHGISYRTRDVRDNLALAFRRASEPGLNVGVLHTNATGEAGHALYCPCTLEDLVACDMDYWALGHIHKQEILRERGPCIAYSGDTQGRSPKPSENGPKGVLVVEARGTTIDSVEFEPVDVVRFVTCSVDVRGVPDVAALLGVVAAEVEGLREEHGGRGLLVRVILRGRGPVASDLRHESGTEGFIAELRAHFSGHDPFVWIEAVKNQAGSEFDLRRDAAARRLRRGTPQALRRRRARGRRRSRRVRHASRRTARQARSGAHRRARGRGGRGRRAAGRRGRRDPRGGSRASAGAPRPGGDSMRIDGWQVDGFGVLKDAAVEDLDHGVTVLLGENEAGKSTLLAFIRAMLYGFPRANAKDERSYPPLNGGRHGGKLLLRDRDDRLWVVSRYGDRKDAELTRPDGTVGGLEDLALLLGHTDRSLFRSVFAFGLEELQQFTTLTAEGVRDSIFSAGISGAGKSARETIDKLAAQQAALLKQGRGEAEINNLVKEIQRVDAEMAEARRLAGEVRGVREGRGRAGGSRRGSRRPGR